MTVNGRLIARAVMALAGLDLAVIGVLAVVTNRVTGREALGGFTALLAGAAAALWLRRENRRGRQP